jgi:hypothetical protein
VLATELPDGVTERDVDLCELCARVATAAESFANTVIFAISQPVDVKNPKPPHATMAGNAMRANRRLHRCSSIGLVRPHGVTLRSRARQVSGTRPVVATFS